MNSYLWYHPWALPVTWDMVNPMQTLNMDDLHSIALSNPSTFVHPTTTPMAMLAITWCIAFQLEHIPILHLRQISS